MTTPRIDGLDVSNHQAPADITWSQVPLFPLMAHKASEGRGYRDPLFVDRWRLFGERGHRWRGAYHWIRSDSPMAAQVANLTAAIEAAGWDQLRPGEFIQLDWETTPGIPNVTPAMVDEWLGLCRARWGDRVIVYSSGWVPGFQRWRAANPDAPLWYAAYPATPAQEITFRRTVEKYGSTIWQWTSTARVPGISGGVDANEVLRPDVLNRIAGLTAAPVPPPVLQEDAVYRICWDYPAYPGQGAVFQVIGNRAEHIKERAFVTLHRPAGAPDPATMKPIAWAELAEFV